MEGSCSICCQKLPYETGQLDVCEHVFCLCCIKKWAKMGGKICPLDRKRFKKVITPTKTILIKGLKRRRKAPPVYDVSAKCEVCQYARSDPQLLVCDMCDLCYHIGCLNPQLDRIPEGQWFCPECQAIDDRMRSRGTRHEKFKPFTAKNIHCIESLTAKQIKAFKRECMETVLTVDLTRIKTQRQGPEQTKERVQSRYNNKRSFRVRKGISYAEHRIEELSSEEDIVSSNDENAELVEERKMQHIYRKNHIEEWSSSDYDTVSEDED